MTSKSTGQTLLEAHSLNRWAEKKPDQLQVAIQIAQMSNGQMSPGKNVTWRNVLLTAVFYCQQQMGNNFPKNFYDEKPCPKPTIEVSWSRKMGRAC